MYYQNVHPEILSKTLFQVQPKAYEGHVQVDTPVVKDQEKYKKSAEFACNSVLF